MTISIEKEYRDSINNLCISKNFICYLIDFYIKSFKIEDYIKKYVLADQIETGELACYVDQEKTLVIGFKSLLYVILRDSYLGQKEQLNEFDYEYLYNELLIYIFHELTHAVQCKVRDEDGELSTINYLIEDSFNYMKDKNFYLKNHDLFIVEHNANVKGCLLRNRFYQKYGIHKDSDAMNNALSAQAAYYLICDYIKDGDKIISPLEQFYSLNDQLEKKKYIITDYKATPYKSMLFGLPINKEIYNEVEAIINNDIKVNSIESYVKKL